MIDISVIIPVYNTGIMLKKTVKSVLNQSYKNIEIILVNDGSNDETRAICEDLEKNNSCIRLINKKNGGLCSARNVGINNARGRYIAFLDHDDEFGENLLLDNYLLAEKYQADIVKFGYKFISKYENNTNKNKEQKSRTNINEIMIIDKRNFSDKYPMLLNNKILVYIWDALYRKDFILNNNIFFDVQYKMGREDIAYNLNCYKYANKIVYNPQVYYKYYLYWSSTYNGINKEKYIQFFDDILRNFDLEKMLLVDMKVTSKYDGYLEYRHLVIIMEIVGFLIEHSRDLTIRNIYYFIKCFSFKYEMNKMEIKKGFKYLKIRQKCIVILYYYNKKIIISILAKIYSKIKTILGIYR